VYKWHITHTKTFKQHFDFIWSFKEATADCASHNNMFTLLKKLKWWSVEGTSLYKRTAVMSNYLLMRKFPKTNLPSKLSRWHLGCRVIHALSDSSFILRNVFIIIQSKPRLETMKTITAVTGNFTFKSDTTLNNHKKYLIKSTSGSLNLLKQRSGSLPSVRQKAGGSGLFSDPFRSQYNCCPNKAALMQVFWQYKSEFVFNEWPCFV